MPSPIVRAVVVRDALLTISGTGVRSSDLDTLAKRTWTPFPQVAGPIGIPVEPGAGVRVGERRRRRPRAAARGRRRHVPALQGAALALVAEHAEARRAEQQAAAEVRRLLQPARGEHAQEVAV